MFCRERSQTHVWSWKIGDASLIARASQVALAVMNLYASARDIRHMRLIPESGRSPGEGNGNPLQYSSLEIPIDRGAWQATIHGTVHTRLSD